MAPACCAMLGRLVDAIVASVDAWVAIGTETDALIKVRIRNAITLAKCVALSTVRGGLGAVPRFLPSFELPGVHHLRLGIEIVTSMQEADLNLRLAIGHCRKG